MLGVLQENLLGLLCYSAKHAPMIRNTVEVSLYGGPYRLIAARCYDYIDRYKKPPGDHIADLLVDKLDEGKESGLYTDIVNSLHASHEGINAEYVFSQLETFVRRQSLRAVAVDLAKALQKDTDQSLDEAETLLTRRGVTTTNVFDPGTRLGKKDKSLQFLDATQAAFPTGIAEFDKRGFGPTRKELWLYIANTKAGKTWALIHLAKMALMHRLRVCHITLEMSEARCSQRYFQALFAIAKRKETLRITKFQKDQLGRISGFNDIRVTPKLALEDPHIRKRLEKLIDKWALRLLDNIYVKQFPTGALTVPQLKAYLDNLELTENFMPDLILVDYPDLMKLDKNNYRLAIDEVYKDLRGLAVQRNVAVAVVSQSHREAAKSKLVGSENVAEAYSKIAHADCVVTYSQTPHERQLGLARLHVAGGRNDADKITVVISQQYGTGGFVVDSTLLSGVYWENIPQVDE